MFEHKLLILQLIIAQNHVSTNLLLKSSSICNFILIIFFKIARIIPYVPFYAYLHKLFPYVPWVHVKSQMSIAYCNAIFGLDQKKCVEQRYILWKINRLKGNKSGIGLEIYVFQCKYLHEQKLRHMNKNICTCMFLWNAFNIEIHNQTFDMIGLHHFARFSPVLWRKSTNQDLKSD